MSQLTPNSCFLLIFYNSKVNTCVFFPCLEDSKRKGKRKEEKKPNQACLVFIADNNTLSSHARTEGLLALIPGFGLTQSLFLL